MQQHSIYNVLNGHCKVPAIFRKPFWQLHKYFCNIARFQWNIFEIFPQYYCAMWDLNEFCKLGHNSKCTVRKNLQYDRMISIDTIKWIFSIFDTRWPPNNKGIQFVLVECPWIVDLKTSLMVPQNASGLTEWVTTWVDKKSVWGRSWHCERNRGQEKESWRSHGRMGLPYTRWWRRCAVSFRARLCGRNSRG